MASDSSAQCATRPQPPAQYPYDPSRCPWTATWSVIGEKWKGIIWWRLANGVGRFGELCRAIPQVSKKMLTQQLREMERDGLVERRAFDEKPLRVEYALTEYGRSLAPVIEAICIWGAEHLRRSRGATADEVNAAALRANS